MHYYKPFYPSVSVQPHKVVLLVSFFFLRVHLLFSFSLLVLFKILLLDVVSSHNFSLFLKQNIASRILHAVGYVMVNEKFFQMYVSIINSFTLFHVHISGLLVMKITNTDDSRS